MQIQVVIDYLDSIYPLRLQEEYDNAGHKVGDAERELTGVLVALDVTSEVIEEAIAGGYNLIVSHHPMIFGGLKSLVPKTEQTRMLERLIKSDICVYSAHTNLDNLKGGVSYILAEKLGLCNVRTLRPMDDEGMGGGAVGELAVEMDVDEFLKMVKERLGLAAVRCSVKMSGKVRRVALCGGSGAFMIDDAAEVGADIYLTADVKYHDYQKAVGLVWVADIGHYESEQFAQELIYNDIMKKFNTFACRITSARTSYTEYK